MALSTTAPPHTAAIDDNGVEHHANGKADVESTKRNAAPPLDFQEIALDRISPSETNPRTAKLDKEKLQELAMSIAEHGVLQPITVRPVEDIPDRYVIVLGERRWRASKLAKRSSIPCIVRTDLSDSEVERIQWIENLQRVDLTPIEEANGYRKLLREHDATMEEIAANVGKPRSHVSRMLALADLPKPLKDAVADGEVRVRTAVLFARIPERALRERAVQHFFDLKTRDISAPHAQIAQQLIASCTLDLGHAAFDPKNAELVPEVGACTACPKRTGNAPDLFGDAPGNRCTDPACFRRKVDAAWVRRKAEAEAVGQRVLAEDEAARLFERHLPHELTYEARREWIDLDSEEWNGDKRVKWRKLLQGKDAPTPVLARRLDGTSRELVPRAAAFEWGKERKLPWAIEAARDSTQRSPEERKREREAFQKERFRKQVLGLTARAVGQAISSPKPHAVWQNPKFWRAAIASLRGKSYTDEIRLIVRTRGWNEKKAFPNESFDRHVRLLEDVGDLREVFWELLALTNVCFSGSSATRTGDFAQMLGINIKAIRTQAEAESRRVKSASGTQASRSKAQAGK